MTFFLLLFTYGAVVDLQRVIFARRVVGVAVGTPVTLGVVAAAGVIALCVWYVRRWKAMKRNGRRYFGALVLCAAVASAIAYLWTHHRYGTTTLTTPLGVGVVTYSSALVLIAAPPAGALVWRAWRADRRTTGPPRRDE